MTGLLLLASLASAGEIGPYQQYVGLALSSVSLIAPEGGLPEADLEPLLRAHQDGTFDLQDVRTDLVTLFRVGEFAAVEAQAEPWFVEGWEVNEAGQPQLVYTPAVALSYAVYPAPRVVQLRVQGVRGALKRQVLDAAGVDVGAVFFAAQERSHVEQRVATVLARKGYPEATVEVDTVDLGEGRTEVWVRVFPGEPRVVSRLSFLDEGLPDDIRRVRKLRKWARQAGVAVGEPVSAEDLEAARYEIRRRLARMPTAFRPWGGWVEARVPPPVVVRGEDGYAVTYTVEAGPRLDLRVSGLSWRKEARMRDALGIDERLRLTRGFVEEAPGRVESYLQLRSYLEASATVALTESEDRRYAFLHVDVDRGPPHRLRRFARRYQFTGASAIPEVELRTVMDQASAEVLKRGRVTPDELDDALRSAASLYASRGYADAELTLDGELEKQPYVPLGFVRVPLPVSLDSALGAVLPRAIRIHVSVDEGGLTHLSDLVVDGAAPIITLTDLHPFLADEHDPTLRPFSPQELGRISQQIVERHRSAGYLFADAHLTTEPDGDGVRAVVTVDPGPRVLLRSVTVRGARRTRPQIIRRDLDAWLTLGQPLTTQQLQEARRALTERGVFRTVSADLVGEQGTGDLLIRVEEKPRYGFELGAGLDTDVGLRGFGRASRRNLWGRAHTLETSGLLGLQWFDLTHPEWRAAITYTAPQFPTSSQRLTAEGLVRELRRETTWRLARSGGGLSLETRLGPTTTLRAGARFEARQLDEVDGGALLEGEPWWTLLDAEDPDLPSPWRLQDSLSLLLLHDRRDDPLKPTRGMVLSLLTDASPGLFSDAAHVRFVKTEGHLSAWVPLRGPILHVVGEGGRVWPLEPGVIALEDRYRLGGTASLRGFRRQSVGPRNKVASVDLDWPDALEPLIDRSLRDDPTRWVSTGGDTMARGTVELELPLPVLGLREWDGYAAALFADVGNTWLLGEGATATSEQARYQSLFHDLVRVGVGAGLRMVTPIGPLRIDVAANPVGLQATGARRKLLRQEWEEPGVRAHLSLGSLW